MAYIGNQPLATAVTNADISSSAAIDLSKLATSGDLSATNVTLGGYLRGPSTFTIDPAAHGDNTGTLVIAGNLQVDGLTTTVNSTTMTVDDKNITVASGAANAAAADGAGITVDGASATLLYNATSDAWSFNKNLGITGTVTADLLNVTSGSSADNIVQVFGGGTIYTGLGVDGTGAILTAGSSGSADAALIIKTSASGTEAERLRITSDGSVGIGTSSPTANLHLSGSGARKIDITDTGGANTRISSASNNSYVGSTTNHPLLFITNDIERMRLTSTGRLDLAKGIVDTTTTVSYASSIALTLDNGAIQTVTLTGNATFTDSLNDGEAIVLMLNGGASHTVTWTAVTKWVTGSGNAAPTLTASDAIILWKIGSSVYAATAGSFA